MRKSAIHRNINRNRQFHNYQRSDVSANAAHELRMDPMWLRDDTGHVEIIELDSDDELTPDSSNGEQHPKPTNLWDHVYKENSNEPNQAREKRHNENANNTLHMSPDDFNDVTDFLNTNCVAEDQEQNDTYRSHRTSYYTIFDYAPVTSDSSDELDIIECTDNNNYNWNNNDYDGQVLSFEEDLDSSKRTIWIYSFKNKRELSDNNFMLVNVPSLDSTSSTSCSLDNSFEEPTKSKIKSISRAPSPIPASFNIARLNLALTPKLPTLTEVTEPSRNVCREQLSKKGMERSQHNNRWVEDRETTEDYFDQNEMSNANVVDWMSLSPRYRRRWSFNTVSKAKKFDVPSPKVQTQTVEIKAEVYVSNDKTSQIKSLCTNPFTSMDKDNDELVIFDIEEAYNTDQERDSVRKVKETQFDISLKKSNTDPIEKLDSNSWRSWEGRKYREDEEVVHKVNNDLKCLEKERWSNNRSLLKSGISDSIPSLQLSIDTDSVKQSWFKCFCRCFRCYKNN